MAAYGASRGELNGDGNQNSATDDYLATPDQRFSQSLITEGQRKDDFSRHTMEAPAPCCRKRRVSSSAYVDIRAQIAAIIRKCQHALSYWEGKLKCVSWWWLQYFTAKESRSFNRARNHGKMCWEELKFKSGGKKKRGVTTPSEEIVEDAVRTICGSSRARCPCTACVCVCV